MKKFGDILKSYYYICGKGEILISIIFVLGISFIIVVEPFIYANKLMGLSMSDDQLKGTILNSEISIVFPFRNGYKAKVGFQTDETKLTETIYTLDKPKRGTQIALNYGYDKNGAIGVICPEIETTYPPMLGGIVELMPFALVALFGCLHIFSAIKRGLKKLRLMKYGQVINANGVFHKESFWSNKERLNYKVQYQYSVNGKSYDLTTVTDNYKQDFKGRETVEVIYDPERPSNAMYCSKFKRFTEVNPVTQSFVGAICLAMSFVFVVFFATVVIVLTV